VGRQHAGIQTSSGIYHGKREQDDETQFWFKWDYFEENVPARIKGKLAGMCCA